MTPELNELLKKIATAKGITALLIIAFLAIFIWRNLDFLTEVTFTLRKPETKTETKIKATETEKKNTGVPQLALGEVMLPPSPRKLPYFAVFEIKNSGSVPTKDVRTTLDFGAAKVVAYEVIGPKKEEVSGSDTGQSIIKLNIVQLGPKESAYLYVQTSNPSFKSIALSSSDTTSVVEYSYSNYLEEKKSRGSPTFMGYLLFLLGGFLLVMTFYLTAALIQKLNKWLKLSW